MSSRTFRQAIIASCAMRSGRTQNPSRSRSRQGTPPNDLDVPVGLRITCKMAKPEDDRLVECEQVTAGTPVTLHADYASSGKDTVLEWGHPDQGTLYPDDSDKERCSIPIARWAGSTSESFSRRWEVRASSPAQPSMCCRPWRTPISGQIGVTLQRSDVPPTLDLGLWAAIRNHAKAMSFGGIEGRPSTGLPRIHRQRSVRRRPRHLGRAHRAMRSAAGCRSCRAG